MRRREQGERLGRKRESRESATLEPQAGAILPSLTWVEGEYGTVGKAEWLCHVNAFPGGASQWNVTEPGKKKRTVNRRKDLVLRRSQMTSEKAGD